jgi:hypothetical protein
MNYDPFRKFLKKKNGDKNKNKKKKTKITLIKKR